MKYKVLAVLASILFMAFNSDEGPGKTMYYNSLKFLNRADGPQKVSMIHPGRRSGQSTLDSYGTLFTYRNRGARSVQISGSFSRWKPEQMTRSDNGIWYYFLPSRESGRDITYKYVVDGILIRDPLNPERIDDRMGSYLSVAEPAVRTEGKQVTWRMAGGNMVEFRFYRPEASFISLVGDFNHWNPEDDLLARGNNGIWRLKKKLFRGVYRYKFIVDGEWMPDVYNHRSASDDTGEVCSVIEIK
jgi:1,4-alpha-glucan branching enzyme